jgi:two-component system sensor histidine kinase/response regulator
VPSVNLHIVYWGKLDSDGKLQTRYRSEAERCRCPERYSRTLGLRNTSNILLPADYGKTTERVGEMKYYPIKTLLVEDNPGDARIICEMLNEVKDVQIEVECADRLSSGLEYLAAGDFDVLLLDLSLPDGQGLDACLRAHAQAENVPIVVLTGFDDETMAANALKIGAQDYLVKGQVDSDLLLRSIRYAIERKRAAENRRRAAEEWRITFDSITDLVFIHDRDFKITRVNKAFADAFNMRPAELIGQPCYEIVHGTSKPVPNCPNKVTIKTKEPSTVEFFEPRLGIRLEVRASPIFDSKGEVVASVNTVRDITERKRAEKEVRIKDSAIASSITAIAIADLEGNLTYVNRAFLGLWGYEDDNEVLGRPAVAFWRMEEKADDLAKSLVNTGSWVGELMARRKDGSHFDVQLSANMVLDDGGKPICMMASFVDITERKRAEEALRESKAQMQAILDGSPDAIRQVDTNLKVLWANKSALARSPDSIGQTCYKAYVYRDKPCKNCPSVKALKTGQIEMGVIYQPASKGIKGECYWEGIGVPVKDDKGKVIGVIQIVRNVTRRKRAEQALRESKRAAEAANRAKGEFLARMSHEIRTPIHGIMGMLELVMDTELEREQREYLNIASSSADSLLGIINDILDFSKIEVGQLKQEEADFDLRATLEQTAETIALRAHKKGLELICHLPPEVPTALEGDAGHLRQVLVNLTHNAVKFTEQGEIVIQVEAEAEREDEVKLHFTIRDTGIGIPEDKKGLIFEAFRQADDSTIRRYGGTGLGLAISQKLVELMGGRIWVESRLGEGSTFHFTVEFKRQDIPKHALIEQASGTDLQGLPVLVIDDNATNRLVLRELLSHWGIEVTEAEDGPTGLQELKRAKDNAHHFRLVLLDKMMPGMDGFTVAEQVGDDPSLRSAIVMMLSSEGVHDDVARCRELGISTYLVKPIRQSALHDAIMVGLRAAPEVKEESGPAGPAAIEGSRLRILVAEDNAAAQLVARKNLEKMGHSVRVAGNGLEVLQMLGEEVFDLILMDMEMPHMNGFEAVRVIREREAGSEQHIPIIAMTAYAMKEDKNRCLKAGTDSYISKPVRYRELYDAIEGLPSLSQEPESTPPVDIDAALQVVDGDKELLREAVGLFLEQDYPRQLKKLREGIKSQNAEAVTAAAHGIKGAVRSFGGRAVGDVAQRLETMGREGNLTGTDKVMKELEAEFKRFSAFFS